MDSSSTVKSLDQTLDSEEASQALLSLSTDTYMKLASYVQRLRATNSPGDGEAFGRLARKQIWLIEVMTRQLLQLRLAKAQNEAAETIDARQQKTKNLLPEERYVSEMRATLTRKEERLVRAVADGQPSFFALVQRQETRRMTTVRIASHMGEIIGADLKRYGPFETNDITRVPVGNAQAMVANGQAIPLLTDEY